VSASGMVETPCLPRPDPERGRRSKFSVVAKRPVIPRLDRGIQGIGQFQFLDAGSVIPDLIRDRHDGPGDLSQDVVDFKSTALKPLVLQTRVV
jgi:hypothetical protein